MIARMPEKWRRHSTALIALKTPAPHSTFTTRDGSTEVLVSAISAHGRGIAMSNSARKFVSLEVPSLMFSKPCNHECSTASVHSIAHAVTLYAAQPKDSGGGTSKKEGIPGYMGWYMPSQATSLSAQEAMTTIKSSLL